MLRHADKPPRGTSHAPGARRVIAGLPAEVTPMWVLGSGGDAPQCGCMDLTHPVSTSRGAAPMPLTLERFAVDNAATSAHSSARLDAAVRQSAPTQGEGSRQTPGVVPAGDYSRPRVSLRAAPQQSAISNQLGRNRRTYGFQWRSAHPQSGI